MVSPDHIGYSWCAGVREISETPKVRGVKNVTSTLSPDHEAAVNRRRRIIFQDDVLANEVFRTQEVGEERMNRIVDFYMSRLDEQPNQIDSIWFEWGEGNTAVWPSEILPCT